MEFWTVRNPYIYNVETPDGIVPSQEKAVSFLRYGDTEVSAGVCYDSGTHKAVSIGFPIEVMKSQGDIDILLASIMAYLGGAR